jgi:ubiquinone/menaquinone biosynthesis C-methylase UbiE
MTHFNNFNIPPGDRHDQKPLGGWNPDESEGIPPPDTDGDARIPNFCNEQGQQGDDMVPEGESEQPPEYLHPPIPGARSQEDPEGIQPGAPSSPVSGLGEESPEDEPETPAPTYPYAPGAGIPLDAIKEEMGEAEHIGGIVRTGSGEMVEYELSRGFPLPSGTASPEYTIGVRDISTGEQHHMVAEADPAEGVVAFDVYTETEGGAASLDLQPDKFVEWSMSTLEEWGADIKHVDGVWSGASTSYQQLQEALTDDEGELPEAVSHTDLGKTFSRLGFTEVEYVNAGPEKDGAVYARFSRPSPTESGGDPSITLDDTLDTAVSTAEDLTLTPTEERRAEIQEYLDQPRRQLKLGKEVTIPTAQGPIVYTSGNPYWHTNADEHAYNPGTFGDEYELLFSDVSPFYKRYEAIRTSALREDQSEVVAGGIAEAFAPGKVALDIASGEAVALLQYSLKYPETTFIGVDEGYAEKRELGDPRALAPGVHLTRGSWNNLSGVASGSVDTIVSHFGVFLHGNPQYYLDAITRVAKEGAIVRFNKGEMTSARYRVIQAMLEERGWHVTVGHNTAVGIKGTTQSE